MKKKIIIFVVVLVGLFAGIGSYFYISRISLSYGIEMERYENKTDGYSIEVPKSWGAIMPYGETFTDNLYDTMEEVGPLVPNSANCDGCFMSVESFTDENSARDSGESWADFYKKLRIEGMVSSLSVENPSVQYSEFVEQNSKYPTTVFTFTYDNDNLYLSECRLVENLDSTKMLAFCFNGDGIFRDIVSSVQFD